MNILSQLEEYANDYNLQAMDALVESLSPAGLEANKRGIIDMYELVFASGKYDLDCDTINDREDFIDFLLRVIDSIRRFFPGKMYYQQRGYCYENLAYCSTAYENKLRYIQQAIDLYNTAPQTAAIQLSMAGALIDKMEITQQFTSEAFTELLSYFKPVLNDASFLKALIHLCFRVRFLPFEQNSYWHQRLLHELETAMHAQAAGNLLVYLNWAEAYHNMLANDSPEIDPAYKAIMVAQTAQLLKPLAGFNTEDAELLYRLGKAFADTAEHSIDNELSLDYYKTAVNFFTKSNELKQTIWSFPVSAIYALLEMAQLYHKQGAHEKLIATFEQGIQLFSQAPEPGEDASLNLYWGEFLVAYTGLAYNYQSPAINQRAEEKLQQAIGLLEKYHTHPHLSRAYFSLARLAIKSGDKEKCVALLLQCRQAIRSKGYEAYDLREALGDEDFSEVWDQLQG